MLRTRIATAAAALLVAASLALPAAPARAQAMDEAQRRAVEEVVRDYLLKHPEVILQAVEAYQEREKAEAEVRAKRALVANRARLFENPDSPVIGNPQGNVTVVEFFDYMCGYCKAVHADVNRLVKEDRNVKLVFKEFPILGPGSLVASKAALAARKQGKYQPLHDALMEHRGPMDEPTVLRLARSVGLDTDRLKEDMESPKVRDVIVANRALADELGIRGTPAFIVGDDIVPGAIKLDEMKRLVEDARKG